MSSGALPEPMLDERTIELIAARVADILRTEFEAIAADLTAHTDPPRPLTVGEVADKFGVARSTVYTHWRAWGGYKLGSGARATIRFDQEGLPERPPSQAGSPTSKAKKNGKTEKRSSPRRPLLRGRPRFPRELLAEELVHTLAPDDRAPGPER